MASTIPQAQLVAFSTSSSAAALDEVENATNCAWGMVDAMTGLPRAVRDNRDYLNAILYSIQSPPVVVGDKIIR